MEPLLALAFGWDVEEHYPGKVVLVADQSLVQQVSYLGLQMDYFQAWMLVAIWVSWNS